MTVWLPPKTKKLRADKQSKGRSLPPKPGLPVIRLEGGELPAIVDAAEAALIAGDTAFYTRGGMIVRPAWETIAVANGGKDQALRLIEVQKVTIAEEMTRCAEFQAFDSRRNDFRTVNCPPLVAETYLGRRGHWKLPDLRGVITAPTLRVDGTVLQKSGYDEATSLLFCPPPEGFPCVPDRPTRRQAEEALVELQNVTATFDFVSDADRSVALSAFLTALARPTLATAPLHGFSAPTAGSGKSLLVDLVSIVATGRRAAVMAQARTEEELEKRLGAAVLGGDAMVSIDNCDQPLGGDFLCQVLTQTAVKVRVLGRSVMLDMPTVASMFATGNNLVLTGDMSRRALVGTIDPRCERPELRSFPFNVVEYVARHRAQLAVAALTILRAYVVAGRPTTGRQLLGSFEDWSLRVRNPLLWLGVADPCDTVEGVRDADPKLSALAAVVRQWSAAFGGERVTASHVAEEANQSDRDSYPPFRDIYRRPELREALLMVAVDKSDVSARRLGNWLSRNQGRIVSGKRIVQDSMKDGSRTWRLEAI